MQQTLSNSKSHENVRPNPAWREWLNGLRQYKQAATRKRTGRVPETANRIVNYFLPKTLLVGGWIAFACLNTVFTQDTRQPGPLSFITLFASDSVYTEATLHALLTGANPDLRRFATLRLSELEQPGDSAIATIVRALNDPEETVRFQALAGLINLGPPATERLAKELSNRNPIAEFSYDSEALNGHRRFVLTPSDMAFCALAFARSIEPDPLFFAYKTATPEGKERILFLLNRTASQLTPAIEAALSGADPALAVSAAGVIGRAGPKAENAVPLLAALTAQSDGQVREAAALALAEIPGPGYLALWDLLHHKNIQTRAYALAAYPYDADSSTAVIVRALNDPDPKVQLAALNRFQSPYRWYRYYSNDRDTATTPYSRFIAALPVSAQQDILLLVKDESTEIKTAAMTAASAISLLHQTFGQAVADTLLLMIPEADQAVQSAAIQQLGILSGKGIAPASDKAAEIMVNYLHGKKYSDETGTLAEVLQHIKLVGPPRPDIIEKMLDICLVSEYARSEIGSLLKSHQGWADAAIRSLAMRYTSMDSLPEAAFRTLQTIGPGSAAYAAVLQQLLGHPKSWIRLSSALILYRDGVMSDKIFEILEEGARAFKGYAGINDEAADLLADSIPGGVDRLITIVKDPKTPGETRKALIYYTLNKVADQNQQVRTLLFDYAADFSNPNLQEYTIWALRSLKTRPAQLEPALQLAFKAKNSAVRKAVVNTWADLQIDPGNFLNLVMADPSADIREAGIGLLENLPETDPRRVSMTQMAIRDTDEDVRNDALEFAGQLGDEGQMILEEYAKSGNPLGYFFFQSAAKLLPLNQSFIAALEARVPDVSQDIRAEILELLGQTENKSQLALDQLYQRLQHPEQAERYHAAKTLLALQADPWEGNGLVAAALMEHQVLQLIEKYLGKALDRLYPPGFTYTSGRGSVLPLFPWPPPPGYQRVLVPFSLFPPASVSTFGGIYNTLTAALANCSPGFEHGLFGIPNGYALIARMERIERDATPVPEPGRWATNGTPNMGLFDFLGDLFFQKPGYFRIIVFAVTDDLAPGENRQAKLPEIRSGASGMPETLAAQPCSGQQVLALVYTFERKSGGKIVPWQDGAPSARQHLEKAGIWNNLKK